MHNLQHSQASMEEVLTDIHRQRIATSLTVLSCNLIAIFAYRIKFESDA